MAVQMAKYEQLINYLNDAPDSSISDQFFALQDAFLSSSISLKNKRAKLLLLKALLEDYSVTNNDEKQFVEDTEILNEDIHRIHDLTTKAAIALESCKSELQLYESELANEHFLPGDLSKFLEVEISETTIDNLEKEHATAVALVNDLKNKLKIQDESKNLLLSKVANFSATEACFSWYDSFHRLTSSLFGISVKGQSSNAAIVTIDSTCEQSVDIIFYFVDKPDSYSIKSIRTEPELPGIEQLCAQAVSNNDAFSLVNMLRSEQLRSLLFEIAHLQVTYPLDWELSERKLRVLFGNDASVVCIFHVPLLYPNDPAKLVHVSNMPEEINVVTLQNTKNVLLTDWLKHIKDFLQEVSCHQDHS